MADSEAETLEDLVADASRRRSTAPADVDVLDPFRREPEVHRLVADQIAAAIDVVAVPPGSAAGPRSRRLAALSDLVGIRAFATDS